MSRNLSFTWATTRPRIIEKQLNTFAVDNRRLSVTYASPKNNMAVAYTQTVQCAATNHLRFSIYLTAKHFQLQREHITAIYDTLRTTVYSLQAQRSVHYLRQGHCVFVDLSV